LAVGTVLMLSVASPLAMVCAQENAPLARLLHDARDFRVRVRAAFVLGNSGQPQTSASLEQALGDAHPAVRAAAATALGRVGSAASLPALRRAANDSEQGVRAQVTAAIAQIESMQASAPVVAQPVSVRPATPQALPASLEGKRYVVIVGNMVNRSEHQDSGAAQQVLANEVLATMRESPDVFAFGGNEQISTGHARQIRERALPTLRLEGNLVRVTRRDGPSEVSVRCEVSIMILDDRQRTVRSAVSGAASRAEHPSGRRQEQQDRLVQQALVRAVRSALTNVGQAFAAAAASGPSSSATDDTHSDPPRGRASAGRRKRS